MLQEQSGARIKVDQNAHRDDPDRVINIFGKFSSLALRLFWYASRKAKRLFVYALHDLFLAANVNCYLSITRRQTHPTCR